MRAVYLYFLKDPVDPKKGYVGKSVNPTRRFRAHLKAPENCRRTNWLRALVDKGLLPELEILAQVPEPDADQWEIDYISAFKSLGFDLMNGTPGGDGVRGRFGEKHPLFGKPCSPERRAKIGIANKGKKHSPETRAKMSVAQLAAGLNTGNFKPGFIPWNAGKKCPSIGARFKGKKRSLESRVKQSASTKGVPWSPIRKARFQEKKNKKLWQTNLLSLLRARSQ